MRLVLVGPPGSGKGTQAKMLVERQKLAYIGTGDILRAAIAAGTEAGRHAEPYIREGNLVPDEIVNELVEDLFDSPQMPHSFVLDGYPRTRKQAVWFDGMLLRHSLQLDAVINLIVSDEEVVRRISARWYSPTSGAIYNLIVKPPRVPGICDIDGKPLAQRPDDREETVRNRLRVFHQCTDSLLDYYRKQGMVRDIETTNGPEEIYKRIVNVLESSLDGH